jgi:hypothetical protein
MEKFIDNLQMYLLLPDEEDSEKQVYITCFSLMCNFTAYGAFSCRSIERNSWAVGSLQAYLLLQDDEDSEKQVYTTRLFGTAS